jgi:fucose 4-O-acetylase-like acetyltransferase
VFFFCKLSDSLLSSIFSFSSSPSACFVVISNWFAKRKKREKEKKQVKKRKEQK